MIHMASQRLWLMVDFMMSHIRYVLFSRVLWPFWHPVLERWADDHRAVIVIFLDSGLNINCFCHHVTHNRVPLPLGHNMKCKPIELVS